MKQTLHSFFLFLILFIGQVNYVKADTTIASGTIDGTSIKWSVTSPDGTQENLKLSITGSGAIPSYQSDFSPWEKYNQKTTEIYVAPTITEIGDFAFWKTAITSFEIPSSCTRIGASAFIHCTNLKEIYIPSNVETIGALAFKGCSSLSLIHYDGRCTSNTIISSNANDLGVANGKIIEKEGTGTSYAKVPSGWDYYTHKEQCVYGAWVAESGTGDNRKLFFYAQKPEAMVSYAPNEGINSQEDPIAHPWRVNCDKYTSIEINRNISAIGKYELVGYEDPNTGVVKGYSNVQTITVESGSQYFVVGEDGVLYNKAKSTLYLYPATKTATHFDVPKAVKNIGFGAFCGAKNLQSISFHSTVNNLSFSAYAFANASSLSYMSFAKDVAPSAPESAFQGLPSEGVVVAPTETDEYKEFTKTVGSNWTFCASSTGVVSYLSSDGTLYVAGNGEYTTSSSNASWYSDINSINKIVVEEGITNIGSSAFSGCTNVTEVTLNNKGSIDYYAFSGCTSLTRVNIGTGVTEFTTVNTSYGTRGPFLSCSKLSTINISDFKSFHAIDNLEYLTNSKYGTAEEKTLMVNGTTHSSTSELVIPEGITAIKNEAIRYFKNVTKIKIPSTVTTITYKNFEGCKYLTEITLPSTVTSVVNYAFADCTGLQTVTLNNKGSIGYYAFLGCTALTRLNIGTGVTEFTTVNTSYGTRGPFLSCSKLSTINISDFKSFHAIDNLEYLTGSSDGTAEEKTLMVNGTTHDSSNELVIPEGVTSIPNAAFRYFKNVTKIKLPSTMTEIAANNFKDHTYLKKLTLPSTVTSVGSDAFSGCTNLERIVCKANTPPSATNSIASNPSEITLKVPSGKAATYRAANIWKEFDIEEGRIYNYSRTMRGNQSSTFVNDMLNDQEVVLKTSTDYYIASSTVSANMITIKVGTLPTYDGTTTIPYKSVVIKLYLEEGDVLVYNVSAYPREVALTDGNAYMNTKEFEPKKISYTRTYAEKYANHLQCFYVPFDVEVTDELLEDFTFYKLYMVSQKDENGNGEIEEDEPLVMLLTKVPAEHILKANTPYYIKPKAESTLTVTSYDTKLYAAENGTVSCATTENEYTLTGINEPTNIKGYYTMSAKGNFSYYTKDTNLGSYRWYMSVTSRTGKGGDLENYARPIQIVIDGEEDTTGIVALQDKASDPKNDKIYTLDGRQVTDYDTLPSGIYIINGKKVFKK